MTYSKGKPGDIIQAFKSKSDNQFKKEKKKRSAARFD
jgi:hypothetical protein